MRLASILEKNWAPLRTKLLLPNLLLPVRDIFSIPFSYPEKAAVSADVAAEQDLMNRLNNLRKND